MTAWSLLGHCSAVHNGTSVNSHSDYPVAALYIGSSVFLLLADTTLRLEGFVTIFVPPVSLVLPSSQVTRVPVVWKSFYPALFVTFWKCYSWLFVLLHFECSNGFSSSGFCKTCGLLAVGVVFSSNNHTPARVQRKIVRYAVCKQLWTNLAGPLCPNRQQFCWPTDNSH